MADKLLSSERDLWLFWEHRHFPTGLSTREGRRVRLLFPGMPNTGPGPDFLGALLALDEEAPKRGDVELHLKASSWQTHGHHRDPRYNGVRLHVVLFDDGGPARTQEGEIVPVLTLGPLLDREVAPSMGSGGPCVRPDAPRPSAEVLDQAILSAGRTRFADRALRWEGEFSVQSTESCMLHALLGAVGLGRNGDACSALAVALDAATLESIAVGSIPLKEKVISAVLLGMAGLLEEGHADEEELRFWERCRDYWPARPLDRRSWQRFRIRPANLPEVRLRAIGLVVARDGLRGFLERCVTQIMSEKTRPEELVELLGSGAGRGWSLEVWTNILLPLIAGYSGMQQIPTLGERAIALYLRLPGGGENHTLRKITALCGLARPPRSAVGQQGLLQIWHTHCAQQRCMGCPLAGQASNPF